MRTHPDLRCAPATSPEGWRAATGRVRNPLNLANQSGRAIQLLGPTT
ncbi:MAG: hypothetical protein AAFO83_14095 [Cyanobacteria bacterium J06607_13]